MGKIRDPPAISKTITIAPQRNAMSQIMPIT